MRAAAVVFVLASACGAPPRSGDLLMDQVRGYNEGVRWRRFEEAAAHVPPKGREEFLDEHEKLAEDLRVDDYEIGRVHVTGDALRAKVQVEYLWHLDSRGVVHKTVARQHWERHGKRWLLGRQERVRGERMPGLEEPLAEPEEEAIE